MTTPDDDLLTVNEAMVYHAELGGHHYNHAHSLLERASRHHYKTYAVIRDGKIYKALRRCDVAALAANPPNPGAHMTGVNKRKRAGLLAPAAVPFQTRSNDSIRRELIRKAAKRAGVKVVFKTG